MPTPRLVLLGPDSKHGARPDPNLKDYVYYAEWREKGRAKRRSLRARLGEDPAVAFARIVAELADPVYKADPSQVKVSDLIENYMKVRASGAKDRAGLIRQCVVLADFFGELAASEITEQLCKQYAATRKTVGTARLELTKLNTIVKYGFETGVISSRPKVWYPNAPVTTRRALSRSELARLLWAMRARGASYRHILLATRIMLYTAARITSVLELNWCPSDSGGYVDISNMTINFNAAGRARTNKVRPVIRMPSKLQSAMLAAKRLNRTKVCAGPRGVPSLKSFEQSFKDAVRDAGLDDRISPHYIAHTTVSMLMDRGVSPAKISKFVGKSIERIMHVYGHLHPEQFGEIDDAL